MHQYSVYQKIEEISTLLPFSEEKKAEIKDAAIQITREYINLLEKDEERFPIDVVLSSIYLSSVKTGNCISHSEISKTTGYSLLSWPRIVLDMDKRVNRK